MKVILVFAQIFGLYIRFLRRLLRLNRQTKWRGYWWYDIDSEFEIGAMSISSQEVSFIFFPAFFPQHFLLYFVTVLPFILCFIFCNRVLFFWILLEITPLSKLTLLPILSINKLSASYSPYPCDDFNHQLCFQVVQKYVLFYNNYYVDIVNWFPYFKMSNSLMFPSVWFQKYMV